MKAVRVALAAAVVAAVALFASTSPAQAYPDVTINVTVSSDTLYGGDSFSYEATANVECTQLKVDYLGDVRTDSGTSTSGSYDTRVVQSIEKDPITATCTFDDGAGGGSTTATALQTAKATGTITLLPRPNDESGDNANRGDSGNGILPNTGGERLLWLLIGGALVLTGGGVVVASRRRAG